MNYQGNWRDIFQNWEALGLSYPEFLESVVFKFVNASTVDGYNPYRITRDGIDWEVHDPSDPWSNIGYWGDHQIVYLLKLIEHSEAYHPGRLGEYLDDDIFVYAHVPYQIKSLDDLFKNPRDSIEFDHVAHDLLMKRTQQIGSDGKLLHHDDSHPIRVNLAEKLLVPVLAKMANFIPDAGIWMNTQRPEWNDANNALVGYGVSMVTLYYLRRYLDFCGRLFAQCQVTQYEVSAEICMLLRSTEAVLMEHHQKMAGGFDSRERRQFVNEIGAAGSCYRELIYDDGLSGEKVSLSVESITRS
ncbi:MAG: hypothetical protein P8N76_17015 [Pirellulaceae bacterium]|nr:hypothetical protein [Pirellulaceae bacterium]